MINNIINEKTLLFRLLSAKPAKANNLLHSEKLPATLIFFPVSKALKMINLSNKAAIRFKIKWKALEERSGDFWKVDIMMIGRIPMLLIVHDYTLFTIVRRK